MENGRIEPLRALPVHRGAQLCLQPPLWAKSLQGEHPKPDAFEPHKDAPRMAPAEKAPSRGPLERAGFRGLGGSRPIGHGQNLRFSPALPWVVACDFSQRVGK